MMNATPLVTLVVTEIQDILCNQVHQINNSHDQCEFIKNTESCFYDGLVFSYNELAFCHLTHHRILVYIILFFILAVLFISMGIVADDFLCPCLLTSSKYLRLPDNIAGVTFLAFGNGAPDIFASINGIKHAKLPLIFSSLYGAGIFVTTMVTGSVLLVDDFTVMKRPIVRDIIFYLGAAFLAWLFIFQGQLQFGHAIALVSYYLCYIITIAISRFVYVRFYHNNNNDNNNTAEKKAVHIPELVIIEQQHQQHHHQQRPSITLSTLKPELLNIPCASSTRSSLTVPSEPSRSRQQSLSSIKSKASDVSLEDGVILARFYRTGTLRSTRSRTRSINQHYAHHHWSNTIRRMSKAFVDFEENTTTTTTSTSNPGSMETIIQSNKQTKKSKPKPTYMSQFSMDEMMSETKKFLIHVCPIDILEWETYGFYKRSLEIIKSVPYFLMTICIPVVDLESTNDNWCRLLTCLNVMLAPQIILFMRQVDYTINDTISLQALLLVISSVLIVLIFLTSDKQTPPFYHPLLAFVGFGISVVFINTIADEIINILQTFGLLFRLSDSILGLTVLAWGNSLGDLISNLSMARHGYHGMAIAACFGGPMLNLLIGLGVPYLFWFLTEHVYHVDVSYQNMMTLLFATITISLFISLTMFILRRFRSSKIHGILLIMVYICYMTTAVIFEIKHI